MDSHTVHERKCNIFLSDYLCDGWYFYNLITNEKAINLQMSVVVPKVVFLSSQYANLTQGHYNQV
jgi:hypothetical protein